MHCHHVNREGAINACFYHVNKDGAINACFYHVNKDGAVMYVVITKTQMVLSCMLLTCVVLPGIPEDFFNQAPYEQTRKQNVQRVSQEVRKLLKMK